MKFNIFYFFISHLLFVAQAVTGEPDNFSARLDTSASIANSEINTTINGVLSLAIDDANSDDGGCDRKKLMNLLRDELDKNFPNVTGYLYRSIPFAGPVDYTQVPYLGNVPHGRTSYVPSAKVSVDGKTFVVGLDKLDHFFSHGLLYWKILEQNAKIPQNKLRNALELGIVQEDGPWGLKGYGVKSYADLSANYKGLFFWRDLLDGQRPIIACENNKFTLSKKFDLENYFDESMDESINCNSYSSLEMLRSIKTFTDQKKISCPISKEICQKLSKNLPPEVANKILHPLCLGTDTSQVEVPSSLNSKDVIDGIKGILSGAENLPDILYPPKRINPKEKLKDNSGVSSK